ncbi:hypothetical protein HBB16_03825 [Pseudonocardia sp. MCCB 268]|nr:hypothetical protein [Pseudonocardia cytotoxica]
MCARAYRPCSTRSCSGSSTGTDVRAGRRRPGRRPVPLGPDQRGYLRRPHQLPPRWMPAPRPRRRARAAKGLPWSRCSRRTGVGFGERCRRSRVRPHAGYRGCRDADHRPRRFRPPQRLLRRGDRGLSRQAGCCSARASAERAVPGQGDPHRSAARGRWEFNEALRLPGSRAFMVVAATAERATTRAAGESALAACDVTSVWRLENDLSLGVLSLADLPRNEEAMGVLDRHAGGPVGVRRSSVSCGLSRVGVAPRAPGAADSATGRRCRAVPGPAAQRAASPPPRMPRWRPPTWCWAACSSFRPTRPAAGHVQGPGSGRRISAGGRHHLFCHPSTVGTACVASPR